MHQMFKKLLTNESGATAIEYALIAALVSIAAIGAMKLVGGSIDTTLTNVSDELKKAQPPK